MRYDAMMPDMPTTEPKSEMGKRIVAKMNELGLNAKQLSLSAGLNETYVRDLLKSENPNPRYQHLKSLASALGVSVQWLDGQDVGRAEIIDIWDRILDRDQRQAVQDFAKNLNRKDNSA